MSDCPNATIKYITIRLGRRTLRLTVQEAKQLDDLLDTLLYGSLKHSQQRWRGCVVDLADGHTAVVETPRGPRATEADGPLNLRA